MKKTLACALCLVGLWQTAASAQSVLTYHGSASRQGAYVMPGLTTQAAGGMHLDANFNGAVDGSVYAQPLFWQPPGAATGQVIVATETNRVYALDGVTGAVAWQTQLAPPIERGLPCGNIDPEGVTGTPVLDAAHGAMFLDASTMTPSGARHLVYGLSLTDGHVLPGWPLDVQAALNAKGVDFSSSIQGNRSAILEVNGDIYLAYAGRAGDCGAYHGTVVQVNTAGPALAGVWQAQATGAGVWSQGGVVQDGNSLLFATGNDLSQPPTQWGGAQAIIRERPGLVFSNSTLDYYVPPNWIRLSEQDYDLGSSGVVPLQIGGSPGQAAGRLIAFGKDGNAYLLNEDNLGGIGGPAVIDPVSRGEIITSAAVYNTPNAAMVAITAPAATGCSGQSVIMLSVTAASTNAIRQAWCEQLNGRGTPIVTTSDGSSDPIVWVTGAQGDNLLHGFDAMSGRVVFAGGGAAGRMSGLQHFQTILAAQDRLYVASAGRIYAFAFH